MIFGNPGVYDYNGEISHFAISVDKLFDAKGSTPIISFNLLLNLTYYPRNIATNIANVYLGGLEVANELLHKQSEELFNMSDEELLQVLITNRYYNQSNFNQEKYFWDLDFIEYDNQGFYPYIINNDDKTRIIVISNLTRKISKKFKVKDWHINSAIIPTDNFLEIISKTKSYILGF